MILWEQLSTVGTASADPNIREKIILSNKIGITIACLALFFLIVYTTVYRWDYVSTGTLILGLAGGAALLANSFGWYSTSRLYLSVLVPVVTMAVSLITKLHDPAEAQDSEFYEYRFIILASGVIPFALFRLTESTLLVATCVVNLILLLSYDAVHNAMGVGYYQTGQQDRTYYFTNVVILLTYLVIAVSLLLVKRQYEKAEERNEELIGELQEAKQNLEERNGEIEAQNQEIVQQSEVLSVNQNRLAEAYHTIAMQKELLENQKSDLEKELVIKNQELVSTNSELIRYNNELRQFSFTVSHNLRGPVATLLGLANIVNPGSLDEEQNQILKHIQSTTRTLDNIIGDLNKIIDIRYDIFKVRQRIDLGEELEKIKRLLENRVPEQNVHLENRFDVGSIYSVKPMVHSILYNLISNSIKYRSAERPLRITLEAREQDDYYKIAVSDNGLGIDLTRYGNDLFKLYRRFHHQADGAGIGLYLVKLQCETLGGWVEAKSELNRFTTFTCYLRKPTNIARQILFDETYASIFYDAVINATGVIWNGPLTGMQYRSAFARCIDFLKAYNTPNWISDLTNQGPIAPEDQQWMFTEIIPEASRNGLKRIGVVQPDLSAYQQGYVQKIKETLKTFGMQQEYFHTIKEAEMWLHDETLKQLANS